MSILHTFRYLLAFSIFFFATAAANGTAVITPATNSVRIVSGLEYMVDTAHHYQFTDVYNNRYKFNPYPNGTLNLGNDANAYWVKFTLRNETAQDEVILELANPGLDSISIFEPMPGGKVRTTVLGESRPFKERSGLGTNFSLPLSVAPHSDKVIFLKISSADALLVPLLASTPMASHLQDKYKDIFWGLYMGLMISMLLYNLFIFFGIKDRDYLFYVFYVASVLITQINISGYAYQLLWPGAPSIAFYSPFFTPFLSGCASIAFTRRFLRTRIYTPRLDKIFLVFYATYILGFGLALSGFYAPGLGIINLSAFAVSFLILTVAIRIVFFGYRPAAYFLVAWSVFLVGIFVFVFVNANVLPYNYFTIYLMPVGSAMEVVLLSFALADKINILKKEKAISQAQALREAEKNTQLIRSQNVVLETKVAERTLELNSLNSELSTTLVDLKGAQTQLVESEKMASLGQLTAGIAHEINNPINFVISNVKPLKRDITMLTGVVTEIETLLKDDPNATGLLKIVNEKKDEIEYDYLINEIDYLLKGITEGSERTAEIVKGLRIFARVDEDDLKTTNIHDNIDSTIIIINALLADKITIERDYQAFAILECYPGKLNQAFLNILTNAIHAIKSKYFSNKGGLIKINTVTDGDSIKITIADNGCGMPDEVGKRIFEPFYSTKEVGEGTGLGLSIAYNIIKKHNGKITYTSVVNQGTEFTLIVPLKQS